MGDNDNLRLFHTGEHACGYWPERVARDLVFDPHDDRLAKFYEKFSSPATADLNITRIDGETLTGQGTSRDVLEASAIAWLDVANRLLRERQPQRIAASA